MVGKQAQEMWKLLNFAYLTGENVIFIGPPGTGKSLIVDTFCSLLGKTYFKYLLTKFTTPDEIFGVININQYKNGIIERNITGMLPDCQIIFLDEVFKASSSILNSLLSIMNERIFFNPNPINVKVEMIVGASNEVPTSDELIAVYDRFLFRYFLEYLSDLELELLLRYANDEIDNFKFDVIKKLDINKYPKLSNEIIELLIEILVEIKRNGIIISDRRKVKLMKVLRILSIYGIDNADVRLILKSILSMDGKSFKKINDILKKFLPDIEDIKEEIRSKIGEILTNNDVEIVQKQAMLMETLKDIKAKYQQQEIVNYAANLIQSAINKMISDI